MLKHIHIENFALIDQLELELYQELTMITGETGAGKSILLGALGLILGNRADLSAVRDPARKCVIEAQFQIGGLELKQTFEGLDLDYEDLSLLRREILPSGKSRAFVNDTPVTLAQMNALGKLLIDIHSQHQTLSLAADGFQMEVLNAFVNEQSKNEAVSGEAVLNAYRDKLKSYHKKQSELKAMTEDQAKLAKELDYNNFLLEELEAAQLDQLDPEALEAEQDQLGNIEAITEVLSELDVSIGNDDQGMLDQLRHLQQRMSQISGYAEAYQNIRERLASMLLELEDVYQEINLQQDSLEADPARLDQVDAQLTLLENLYRKHQVSEVQALKEVRDELADKVFETAGLSDKIQKLEVEIQDLKKELSKLATTLSELRQKYKPALEAQVLQSIHQLGMPDAQFVVSAESTADFGANGQDKIQFLFTANKGTSLLPLDKAASGGELSRLMLAIKALLSRCKKLPTIIFDEIDTGVSGAIADKMAAIMKEMSAEMQVITITHLPQIAAAGNDHLIVKKENIDDRTISKISRLDETARLEEIAQMLSGGIVSEAARENARALLN